MASIKKRGSSWRVFIRRKNLTKAITATFRNAGEARDWAARQEAMYADDKLGRIPDFPFITLLERYRDQVSTGKKGEQWDRIRINAFARDPMAQVNLRVFDSTHVANWRDRRLKVVSAGTVRREWNLLSAACNVAVKEWKWLRENPMKDVKRPPPPEPRDMIYTDDEIERLTYALGTDPTTVSGRVGIIVLFALETAMRAGEMCDLTWSDVNFDREEIKIPANITKSNRKREVPLTTEAIRLLRLMPCLNDSDSIFNLDQSQLDVNFRKGKRRAMIIGKTFHDLRHTAITRLAGRIPNVLELARMVGHKNLNMLLVYYNKSASDLAKQLNANPLV